MADILLTQHEGDTLLAMRKVTSTRNSLCMPFLGGKLDIPLQSENGKENFVLNYTQHFINLAKRNHHIRVREVIGLARLDLDGPPHRNPDGKEIGPRHLHIYRENFALKWAFEVPEGKFSNLEDVVHTLEDFMTYCNVISIPSIQRALVT